MHYIIRLLLLRPSASTGTVGPTVISFTESFEAAGGWP